MSTDSTDSTDSVDPFDALLREAVRVSDATGPAMVRLSPGDRLCDGRLEVVGVLGAGGMGVVFEAIDHQLGERVAIKFLQARGTSALQATQAEFLTLHDLAHRNLVRLGELLQDGDRWLYSMELVRGRDFLAAVRPGGALDERRLREALAQLALGVVALHDANVIHRDLKPSNVLVDHDGRVVLVDFGLAQSSDSTARTGGTVAYMPPEQAAGRQVGPAADLYAIGTMVYEALTGALPFDVGSAEAMQFKRAGLAAEALEGVAPADLAELARALLAPEPGDRPTARDLAEALGAAVAQAPPPAELPFVGRATHLAELRQAFDDRTGGWVTVHVQGEAGIGKTAMLSAFAASLQRDGVVVLRGRCHERVSVPYKTLHGVATELAQHLQAHPEAAATVGADAPLLAAVFPMLADLPGAGNRPSIADPQQQRAAAFRAFARVLTSITETTPVAMLIDDLQWADAEGLQLLDDVARHAATARLLLVVGSRGPLGAGTPHLTRTARSLELGPLTHAEGVELARAVVSEQLSEQVAARAGGHPLYLTELAHGWTHDRYAVEAPELATAVARRALELPPDQAAVLELACLVGEPLPQRALQRASQVGAEFQATLAALRAERWVRTGGPRLEDSVEPYHAVVRDAVAASIDADTRTRHHGRLADAMDDGDFGERHPELLAHHLEGAGRRIEAAAWAKRAAAGAEAVLAFDRAAAMYRRALELDASDAADDHERLGQALANAGRGADAAEAFLAAARLRADGGADLRRRAAEQLLRAGHADRGLDLIDEVLREQRLPALRRVRWPLARLLMERARLAVRGRQAEAAELSPQEDLRLACCWSASVGAAMTSPLRAAAYQTRHLRLALEAGDPRRIALGLTMEAIGSSAAGPPARRAHAILAEADRWVTRVDTPEVRGYALVARATIAFLCGQWLPALRDADRAEHIFRSECIGCAWEVGTSQRIALTCLWHLGRVRELSQRAALALEDAEERGDLYASTQLRTVLQPNIHLMHDDLPAARAEIERARSGLARTAIHLQHWQHMQASSLVELYAGAPERAVSIIDETLPAVKRAFLFRVLAVRVFTRFVHGTALIGAAARAGSAGTALLERAEHVGRALGREIGGDNGANLLAAQAAELRGHDDRAARLYRDAHRGFVEVDTHLMAWTCQMRLGELTADQQLIDSARDDVRRAGVANPDRVFAMLAPIRRSE